MPQIALVGAGFAALGMLADRRSASIPKAAKPAPTKAICGMVLRQRAQSIARWCSQAAMIDDTTAAGGVTIRTRAAASMPLDPRRPLLPFKLGKTSARRPLSLPSRTKPPAAPRTQKPSRSCRGSADVPNGAVSAMNTAAIITMAKARHPAVRPSAESSHAFGETGAHPRNESVRPRTCSDTSSLRS